jgi:hypothetical protein
MREKSWSIGGQRLAAALCALSAPAAAQQMAQLSEPIECIQARALKGAGKAQDAAAFQRQCDQKKGATQPPSAPGPATSRPTEGKSTPKVLPPANWAARLPGEAKVRAAMHGATPADTALQQQAAFAVLKQLTSELAGFGAWPPAAVSKMHEYDKASPDRPTNGPRNPYVLKPDFQREVLSKLVEPQTARAYMSTSWFKDLEAPSLRRQQQAEQASRDAAAATAAAKAADAAIPQWVKADVSKAQRGHVDLTFFGLEFGKPVALPKCDAEETSHRVMGSMAETLIGKTSGPRGTSRTCVVGAGEMTGGTNGMANGILGMAAASQRFSGDAVLPGQQTLNVALASESCPSWVESCSVSVLVVGGVAVGASMQLSPDAGSLAKAPAELRRKYGPADVSQHLRCSYQTYGTGFANGVSVTVPTGTATVEGTELTWTKLAGLYAYFTPYQGSGCVSNLYVELAGAHASAVKAKAHAEPTM